MINPVATGSENLFRKVLKYTTLLTVTIALVAGVTGYVLAGLNGLVSSLIGAGMALVFGSLTALSIWLGGKLPLAGFYGLVMGGWLLKMLLFLVLVGSLKSADFVVGPVLFLTLVATVVGSLAIDTWLFSKARLPIEPR